MLRGEVCLAMGEIDHRYPEEAIEVYISSSDNAKYARAKYLFGWKLQLAGEYPDASEALLESHSAFMRVSDILMAGKALNKLAFISVHQGKTQQAIHHLQKCVDCFRQAGCEIEVANQRCNLALVCFLAGHVRESLSTYRSISKILGRLSQPAQCGYYLGHAVATALTGDSPKVERLMRVARELANGFKRREAQFLEMKAWIALLDNDYKTAESALKKGLALSLEIAPESTLISQIKRLYGDLYVATKRFDLAEKSATEALEVATKLTERAEIAACHRVFAQVAQHRGHEDKARDEFQQAIDLYSQIGARYELAATRYLAGVSMLYRNGERTALLYLAREYFESEDIKHYVRKIDDEFAKSEKPVLRHTAPEKKGACGTTPTVIAVNPAMRKLISLAENVAGSEMTVLLTGETGTGKDLLARYIHHHSGRTGRFVSVNAAAVPGSMIESELFGHSKGAFTGATTDRAGLFEQANDGTFYLNEIADASLEFQAKLLQVLETRTVRRLGDNQERPVSFRLIAATNHDLQKAINEQKFRLDLFHRLREIPIHLPPLSERTEDIPALVDHILKESGIDSSRNGNRGDIERLARLLSSYPWPGNVRDLRSRVKQLTITAQGDLGRMHTLALSATHEPDADRLLRILESTGWNRSRAAEILGVSEGTIRNRIRKFALEQGKS